MIIGRLGPLTLAQMVGREAAAPRIGYLEEHVAIG